MKNFRWLIVAALTPLPWLFIELTGGGRRLLTSHPGIISILAGLAIVGANRLLIGVGWALVAIVYYFRLGNKATTNPTGSINHPLSLRFFEPQSLPIVFQD